MAAMAPVGSVEKTQTGFSHQAEAEPPEAQAGDKRPPSSEARTQEAWTVSSAG